MESIILIAIVILILPIIMLFLIKSEVSSGFRKLNNKFDALSREIEKQQELLRKSQPEAIQKPSVSNPQDTSASEALIKQRLEEQERKRFAEELEIKRKAEAREKFLQEEKRKEEEAKLAEAIFKSASPKPVILTEAKAIVPPKPPIPPAPPKPGFFERNPDMEKFIGENLANKIGIAILVLGIGFFVKYAIDKEWINEIGRVFIGILCGGILIGIAHKLRNTFNAFSSVLVGGGIAILYFTIAIAFHEYAIFGQTAAFLLMVAITGFSILLSLVYNRQELAVLSILGGFGTPFMVSTGEGNYIVLFSYLLILNVGMVVLAYFKKWKLVNILSYIITIIIFFGWAASQFKTEDHSMIRGSIAFATAFYLVFFIMNIINNLKEQKEFEIQEISILISNTFLYYCAGMYFLNNATGYDFRGLFTASIGVFNFIFAFALFKSKKVGRNLVFLLIGLVLTFISLAAPIQLEGNNITLFWAAEAVLLLWLSQKSGIGLMKNASIVIMALMIVSLAMDWANVYFSSDIQGQLNVVFNKGFVTGLVALTSIILTLALLKKETKLPVFSNYKTALTVVGLVLFYFMNRFELSHHLYYLVEQKASRNIILGSYDFLVLLGIMIAGNRAELNNQIKKLLPLTGVFSIVLFISVYYPETISARNEFIYGNASGLGFYFHFLMVALLVLISSTSLKGFIKTPDIDFPGVKHHWWFFTGFFIFLLSIELDHLVLLISYTPEAGIAKILSHNHKIGYPILWGISAFLLIAIGLKEKIKDLRIISLCLLALTLIKLFVFDIRGISEGGKIAAFISLGVLLLIVSFMYQKLKKLLLEDKSNAEPGL